MPPATFSTEEVKKAFYANHYKKIMEKYYSNPEFRQKLLDDRKALYQKHKELGIGRFSPEGKQRNAELAKIRHSQKKAEKNDA